MISLDAIVRTGLTRIDTIKVRMAIIASFVSSGAEQHQKTDRKDIRQ